VSECCLLESGEIRAEEVDDTDAEHKTREDCEQTGDSCSTRQHTCTTYLYNTPVRHTCTTHLYDIPVQHTCTTYLACHYISTYDTPVRHTCMTHLTCHTWHVCTARQHCQSNSNVILLLHYFSVLVFTASGLIVLHTGLPVDGDYVPRWNILSTQTIISHNTSQHHMVGVSASVNLSLHHKSPCTIKVQKFSSGTSWPDVPSVTDLRRCTTDPVSVSFTFNSISS